MGQAYYCEGYAAGFKHGICYGCTGLVIAFIGGICVDTYLKKHKKSQK